jgi:DeoR/GlpR family transcriptional regulator of sugar metabolism
MLITERHQKIMALLQKEKTISTKKLRELLYVSEATLRRDLKEMEQRGLLQRTYGGATIVESPTREASIIIREQKQIREKRRIAVKCLEFINDHNSYFIDSSSTVSFILYNLDNFQDITFITNGLRNASILADAANVNLYLTGGKFNAQTNSIVGSDTVEYIKNFNCHAFFFSCSGISLNAGITEANVEQKEVKREMLKRSKIHILLADHTKFNKIFLCRNCGFEDIDYLITDELPDQAYLELFEKTKTKVIVA